MKTSWIILAVVAVIVVIGGVWFFVFKGKTETPVAKTSFSCDAGKTITATFYKDSAELVLSDGRKIKIPQTVSASGTRYATKDESLVFWNKGNTAYITEGSIDIQTFSNCVTPDASGRIMQTYASTTLGYTIKYPQEYVLNESYAYDQFGPQKLIHGISFTVPEGVATGTNLSPDTRVSVEELPRAKNCTADIFLRANVKAQSLSDNGVDYSIATSTDAAAGNRYEEVVYALVGSNPCTAIRYFIHYGVFENYPIGSVHEYDKTVLLSDFDTIRRSLTLTR